jgi:hypothetical protein
VHVVRDGILGINYNVGGFVGFGRKGRVMGKEERLGVIVTE